jgi:hypothetical protein
MRRSSSIGGDGGCVSDPQMMQTVTGHLLVAL